MKKGSVEVVCPDCGVTRYLWPFEVKKQKGPWALRAALEEEAGS